ncbi:MAG: class B sortase [Lachnospiraceae bacterium]|jgi:sortase B
MKKYILAVCGLILLGLSLFCGYCAYVEYEPILTAEIQKRNLKKVVIHKEGFDEPMLRRINFAALQEINKDIAGWIYIPDTSVDYPILLGEDYLEKDMEGRSSKAGSIFAYSDTDAQLLDARVVVFGHNMRESSMFGELKYYLDEEFRSAHGKLYIYTADRTMEAEIFSVFVCEETDPIFENCAKSETALYRGLLQELDDRNMCQDIALKDVAGQYEKQCFSMVTCKGSPGTSKRLMVNGIVVQQTYVRKN